MTARIIGTGSSVPVHKEQTTICPKWWKPMMKWISSRTGIKERRLAGEETTVSMSVAAAKIGIGRRRSRPVRTGPDHCSHMFS